MKSLTLGKTLCILFAFACVPYAAFSQLLTVIPNDPDMGNVDIGLFPPALPTTGGSDFEQVVAPAGQLVQVRAYPNDGYRFVRWQGVVPAAQSESNPTLLNADGNPGIITAVFEEQPGIRLSVQVFELGHENLAGVGIGTVRVSRLNGVPVNLDPNAEVFAPGSSIQLTAYPLPLDVGGVDFQSFVFEWGGEVAATQLEASRPHGTNTAFILEAAGGETVSRQITILFSREYHPGEGVGDLDLDGLPDIWELRYGLDPKDPTGDNGPEGNISGDFSMPTAWRHNRFESGNYPADPNDVFMEPPYRFHIDGSRPENYYLGVAPFDNWLQARGFDGWFSERNPRGVDPDDLRGDPRTDPRRLSTTNDGIPDGWKYWFYASALMDPSMEGVRINFSKYVNVNVRPDDPDENDAIEDITNMEIRNAFRPWNSFPLGLDLDGDCSAHRVAGENGETAISDILAEFMAGTDPIHWDTDDDKISDGYEIRMGLNPIDPEDGEANFSGDYMAFHEEGGVAYRHGQVYDKWGFDPRTGWGENYLGRGDARSLNSQPKTIPFNNREHFLASIYLAVREGDRFTCDKFNTYALNPLVIDTDGDGIFDGWELYVGLNPKNPFDADVDQDGDGLTNFQEFSSFDKDLIFGVFRVEDGRWILTDNRWPNGYRHFDSSWKNKVWPTDPNVRDTDGDGLSDGTEGGFGSDDLPGDEIAEGSLRVKKYAGDVYNWNGSCYVGGGLNPTSVDTDGDGIPDHWEATFRSTRYDINDLDDRNGMDGTLRDALRDYDEDGLLNYQEYLTGAIQHWRYSEWVAGLPVGSYDPFDNFTGTPRDWDWHVTQQDHPYFYIPPYRDENNRVNTRVPYTSTNPRLLDTDLDGMDDYWEIYHGLNPLFGTLDIHASMLIDGRWVLAGVPDTFDIRNRPHVAGSPFADPDQDGLPNSDEALIPNSPAPYHYHTGPSPLWVTDISYDRSWANLYYARGGLENFWYFGGRGHRAPRYLFSFAVNEGFDTDGDMLGDRAELVDTAASPGTTDPLSVDSPPRRRALYLNGDAAARTRNLFLHGQNDLREFTVEAWVKPENPAMGRMQVIIERPMEIPNGNVMGFPEGIRRNFRLGLDENGIPFVAYNGAGFDALYEEAKATMPQGLEANRWYHLAGVYNATTKQLYIYVDGVMRGSASTAERPSNGWFTGDLAYTFTAPLVIGARDENPAGIVSGQRIVDGAIVPVPADRQPSLHDHFEGWIDEIRVWSSARTTAEINLTMGRALKMDDVRESRQLVEGEMQPELLYLYNFNNLLDPVREGVAPEGFEFLNGRPDDGSYPHVPWWGLAEHRSLVYNNYHYIPWIANVAARLPLDPPADSPYHRSEIRDEDGNLLRRYNFPNSANPYNFAYYTGVRAGSDLGPDSFQGVFTPRRSPLFTDLLPLRFARVDATVEMWDGAGDGLQPFDSNLDGIPDWWYLRHGFDPLGPSIANEDPDDDGINNYWEYRLGSDPHNAFSLDPNGIISDGDWDSDGDGLSNFDELNVYFTDPSRPDTDDDGINDGMEVARGFDPRSSISPFVFRAMRFGETGGTGEVVVSDRIDRQITERHSFATFTLEAYVRPHQFHAARVSLISRRIETTGRRNYELGLNPQGQVFIAFDSAGQTVEAISGTALPLNEWTHVAARFDPTAQTLSLFVNGDPVRTVTTSLRPVEGPGDLIFAGNGYRGDLKEVRMWAIPRTLDELRAFQSRTLFFGTEAVDPGVLRVFGDSGHLRQNSTTISPVTLSPVDHLQNWTLEAWIKTTSSQGGTIIARWNTSTPGEDDFNYYLGLTGDGRLIGRFALVMAVLENEGTEDEDLVSVVDYSVNNIIGATRVNDGQWHHVAYVRDSQYAYLYVNGILDVRQNRTLIPMDLNVIASAVRRLEGPLVMGYQLDADMDEVRVWDRGLSSADLRLVNSRSLAGVEDGLVSYFNFNFQRTEFADERAAIRDPVEEFGVFIPSALHVRTGEIPPIELDPVLSYRGSLGAYFSADDGGETVEDFTFPLDFDYAGEFVGDARFIDLGQDEYPFSGDSSGDGLPDWWKTLFGLDPGSSQGIHGPWGDPDRDGLPNIAEFWAGTNPRDFDTSGNGFSDFDTRVVGKPITLGALFTDMDGMDDAWEAQFPTVLSPLVYDAHIDSDGDGWSNFAEFMADSNPADPGEFPRPRMNVRFDYTGVHREGPIRVYIYDHPRMDGRPVAIGTAGDSQSITSFTDVGRVAAGGRAASGVIPNVPIVPGSVTLVVPWAAGNSITYVDQGNGVLRSTGVVPIRFGEINYESGVWSVNIAPDTRTPNAQVRATWSYFIGVSTFPFEGVLSVLNGHLKEGSAWAFAYIDRAGTGTWNEGDPAAIAALQPINVSWGDIPTVFFGLTDSLPGYQRFAWEPVPGMNTYTVQVTRTSTPSWPIIMRREVRDRTYIHEGDYQYAGHFGLHPGTSQTPGYEWLVWTRPELQSDTFEFDWRASLSAPQIESPVGIVNFAKNAFTWRMSRNAVQAEIEVRRQSPTGGAGDLVPGSPFRITAPFRRSDGSVSTYLPIYAGDDVMPDGRYYWRVREINPVRQSAFSDYRAFDVALQGTAMVAHSIAGHIHYHGPAQVQRIVVQAFTSPGFSGKPEAQITLHVNGEGPWPYTIRGLRAGTYYVRAFADPVGDKQVTNWKSWGFIRDDDYFSDYLIAPINVPANQTGQRIILRDRDTTQTGVPDALEYETFGRLNYTAAELNALAPDHIISLWSQWRAHARNLLLSDGSSAHDHFDTLLDSLGLTAGQWFTSESAPMGALEEVLGPNPPTHNLFEIMVEPSNGMDIVSYVISPAVAVMFTNVTVHVQAASSLMEGFQDLPFSTQDIYSGSWMTFPDGWQYTNTLVNPLQFYRIRWDVKRH